METRWRRIARVRLPQATSTLTTRGRSNTEVSTRPGLPWAQGKRPDVQQRAWRPTAPKNSQQPPRPVQDKVEERLLLSRQTCWSCWHVCIPITFRFVGWRPTCLVCDRRPTCRHHTFPLFCLPSSLPSLPMCGQICTAVPTHLCGLLLFILLWALLTEHLHLPARFFADMLIFRWTETRDLPRTFSRAPLPYAQQKKECRFGVR